MIRLKYFLSIMACLLFLFVGIAFSNFKSINEYKPKSITLFDNQGKEYTETILDINNKNSIYQILGNIFINVSVSILISLVIVSLVEKKDKINFENKLLEINKIVATNAMLYAFDVTFDKALIDLIKEDLLYSKIIRKDAHMHYKISINNNKAVMERYNNYKIYNLSRQDIEEKVDFYFIQNPTVQSRAQLKEINEGNPPIILADINSIEGKTRDSYVMKVPGNSYKEMLLSIEQVFSNEYIYETFFSGHYVIDMRISVDFPKNFEFNIESHCLDKLVLKVDEPGKKEYILKKPIYKGQGFEFVCYPKNAIKSDKQSSKI